MDNDDDNIINFPTSIDDSQWIEKTITHPCETVFDIEPNSTVMTIPAPRETELIESPLYDEKDKEIEKDFQEIYDASMDAYDQSIEDLEGIEGKYKARNSEVAVQFLNTALAAAKEKSRLKEHKDKLKNRPIDPKNPSSGVTNNTQINITPAELVRMMVQQHSPINNLGETSPTPEKNVEPSPPTRAIPRKRRVDPQEDSTNGQE